jgi:hypothetical protein
MLGGEKVAEKQLKLEMHSGGDQAFQLVEDTNENSG